MVYSLLLWRGSEPVCSAHAPGLPSYVSAYIIQHTCRQRLTYVSKSTPNQHLSCLWQPLRLESFCPESRDDRRSDPTDLCAHSAGACSPLGQGILLTCGLALSLNGPCVCRETFSALAQPVAFYFQSEVKCLLGSSSVSSQTSGKCTGTHLCMLMKRTLLLLQAWCRIFLLVQVCVKPLKQDVFNQFT